MRNKKAPCANREREKRGYRLTRQPLQSYLRLRAREWRFLPDKRKSCAEFALVERQRYPSKAGFGLARDGAAAIQPVSGAEHPRFLLCRRSAQSLRRSPAMLPALLLACAGKRGSIPRGMLCREVPRCADAHEQRRRDGDWLRDGLAQSGIVRRVGEGALAYLT